MLQTKNLQFSYNNKQVLTFPDIFCEKGEQCLLLGQSGSGKTTLLNLLGGLATPKKGQVLVAGQDLNILKANERDRFRGQHIGIVFQRTHFVRALTVGENLALAQSLAGHSVSKTRIQQLLDRLNIGHKYGSRPDSLSQGEQQRVAIARALVNKPTIILADEPTSALDDYNCEEVVRLLENQASVEQATLLVVTHDGRLKERFAKKIFLESQNQGR
ncbi:MAG: ATP-binding cassette domain-containing protein [Bacteroidota bacterium]